MRCKFLEPLVMKSLFTVISLWRTHCKQVFDQVLTFFRNFLELSVLKGEITLLDFVEDFSGILALERQVARYEGIQEHTKGPHVGFVLVWSFNYLWCHVIRSSSNCMHQGVCLRASVLRETKVYKFNVVISGYHNIFRLDISVDNANGVAVKHCAD